MSRRPRYKPQRIEPTGNVPFDEMKRAEEREFQQRMRDGLEAQRAGHQLRKRAHKIATKDVAPEFRGKTPRFKIAKGFRPGWGRLS